MKAFEISDKQLRILNAAVDRTIYTGPGSGYYYHDRDCQHMVKRGWLTTTKQADWQYGSNCRAYAITDMGRAVARQLARRAAIDAAAGQEGGQAR